MKVIIILICVASLDAKASYDYYVKIGAGYKLQETRFIEDSYTNERIYFDFNDPFSARIEIGIEHEHISYGISHHSNWLTGYPFNDKGELQKTELFIDYKFTL